MMMRKRKYPLFVTTGFGAPFTGVFFAVKEVSLLDQGSQGKQSIYQLEQNESTLYIFLELVKGLLLNLNQTYNLKDSQVSAYTNLFNENQIKRSMKFSWKWSRHRKSTRQ
ncbi:hypothetical protein ACFE04_001850 [Oxalis oulophora]